IVDDLLYLARLDAEPALRREPVDLTTVVRDCVADALAVQPGRPTGLSLPETCPVRGDVDALHQVMANLLANVAAHTPPGTPVAIRLACADGTARVEVHDEGPARVEVHAEGPGMPPETAGRAFDRFTRGDTGRGHGGSGLGLAIVAEIVAAHGGTVSLQSRPGGGTTVTFAVPAADS